MNFSEVSGKLTATANCRHDRGTGAAEEEARGHSVRYNKAVIPPRGRGGQRKARYGQSMQNPDSFVIKGGRFNGLG